MLNILTIGGATQDITFHTKEGLLIDNKKDLIRQQLIGFEFGAKINIPQAEFTFGGGAANTAVNFANLKNSVSTLICLGEDAVAKQILENLKNYKIKTDLIQASQKNSGLSFVLAADNLKAEHVLFTFRGANEDLKIDLGTTLQDAQQSKKFNLIYLASLSGKNSKNNLAKIFRYKTKNKSTDLAWNPGNLQIALGLNVLKPYLQQTDFFILNKDEAIELTNKKSTNIRQLLKILAEFCPGVIVITDGSNGAYAYLNKKIYYQESCRVKIKDTTGVGDAFSSTFVWAYYKTSGDIQKSLELGIKNATSVLQKTGAQHGLIVPK